MATKYQYPSVAGNTRDSVRPTTKPVTAPTVSARDPKVGCASGYGYTGGNGSAGGYGNADKSANPFSSLAERWSRNPFTIMDSVVEATMLVGDGISLVKAVGNLIKGKNVLVRGREMLSKALGLAKGKGGTRVAAYADDAARVGVKSGGQSAGIFNEDIYIPDNSPVININNLPGNTGIKIPRRLTTNEMTYLTQKHGIEFAQVYQKGTGINGRGGNYSLYSGNANSVKVPINKDIMLINHTHPGGTGWPSTADKNLLSIFEQIGSPQRTSEIIPIGRGNTIRFDKNGIRR